MVTGTVVGFIAAVLVLKVIAKKIAVKCKLKHEYDDAVIGTQLATAPTLVETATVPASTENPSNASIQSNRTESLYAYALIQRRPQAAEINTKGNVSYVPS